MLTPSLKLYAVPLALLMMSVGSGVQTAHADTSHTYRTIKATLSYNGDAPASQIYKRLSAQAERVCKTHGPRPLALRKYDKECADQVVDAAVKRIARTDLAAVHGNAQQRG